MSKKANTAMIGAFVIGAVILAVVGILAFGSGAFFRDRDQFVLYFDGDLKGLSVGAPVLFRGVPVGQVLDICVFYNSRDAEFDIPVYIETDNRRFHEVEPPPDEDLYRVDPNELDRLIKHGLRGQLSLQSLVTGQLAVSLDLLPGTPVNLRGDGSLPEIPTVPSSIERLANALEELDLKTMVDNINTAMIELRDVIEERGLENLVQNFTRAAHEVAMLAEELRGRSGVMADEIKKTATSARGLIQNLDRQVDPVADEAIRTMNQIQDAMAKAENELVKIERLTADYSADSDFGYDLSTALNEIAATARSVRALTEMLQQQPDVLLRGKTGSGEK
ncbi:MAG: MlaD family protein [Desulfobacterales bacterium]|nr:MlaD family protein [Desulfobacterales bacterium]